MSSNIYMELLEVRCKMAYKACRKARKLDDRKLFVNKYELLVEAINEDATIKSPMLRVATTNAILARISELAEFAQSLKDRNMISV